MIRQPQQQTTPLTPAELRPALPVLTLFLVALALSLALLTVVFWNGDITLTALIILGGVVWVVRAYVIVLSWWREQRRSRQAVQRAHVAQLEGELGLPILMVGQCWNCHKPLAAGARFCTYCGRVAEQPTAKVCAACQTRNPLDGVYCIECGTQLPDEM